MARIVTVYNTERRAARIGDMSYIRWFRISQALARLGHQVDIATAEFKWRLRRPVIEMGPGLRRVPLSRVRWGEYDVVKALFHQGYRTLRRYGGAGHPFLITKLGTVVGSTDREGIYFYGRQRRRMFAVQRAIDRASRYVTVLSEPARALWEECFGPRGDTLLVVPGAADRDLPPPGPDPYPPGERIRCVFAGNVYDRRTQPQANRVLVDKLNALGALLGARGARLYLVGVGDVRRLDPRHAVYLGAAGYEQSWDYLRNAHVGVLVAAGPFMHNNESTKIYHYLRVGLPVVSEAGFPNDWVLRQSGLSFIVENGRLDLMADRILEAAVAPWDRDRAIRYILERHTWDHRAQVYAGVLGREGRS